MEVDVSSSNWTLKVREPCNTLLTRIRIYCEICKQLI
mgnify:CR=1 FL=1